MKKPGRKLAAVYDAMSAQESFRRFTPRESQSMTRQALAIIPRDETLDDVHSPFFASTDIALVLSQSEAGALDSMIESHGVKNVLHALVQLIESRVEEIHVTNGRVLHHLSREDAYSYAAERLLGLVRDPRIAQL